MINNLLTAVSQQRAERLICRKSRVSFHDEAVLSDTVFRPRDVTIRNSANALIGGRNMAGRPNSICATVLSCPATHLGPHAVAHSCVRPRWSKQRSKESRWQLNARERSFASGSGAAGARWISIDDRSSPCTPAAWHDVARSPRIHVYERRNVHLRGGKIG